MAKKIIILNGPNLNLLGTREVDIYGNQTFETYFQHLVETFDGKAELSYFQSNHEGHLIDRIHEVGFTFDGIVFNPGGLSHTSIALADALAAVSTPCVEVHISNIHSRESYREKSFTGSKSTGCITGLGLHGYALAISFFLQ